MVTDKSTKQGLNQLEATMAGKKGSSKKDKPQEQQKPEPNPLQRDRTEDEGNPLEDDGIEIDGYETEES